MVDSQEDIVVRRAIIMAGAGFDHHHLAHKRVSFWALEFHFHGVGCVWSAAAPIHAAAAELGTVSAGAGAACELKVDHLAWLWVPHALLPLLKREDQTAGDAVLPEVVNLHFGCTTSKCW